MPPESGWRSQCQRASYISKLVQRGRFCGPSCISNDGDHRAARSDSRPRILADRPLVIQEHEIWRTGKRPIALGNVQHLQPHQSDLLCLDQLYLEFVQSGDGDARSSDHAARSESQLLTSLIRRLLRSNALRTALFTSSRGLYYFQGGLLEGKNCWRSK
jgi:hypothetical protein